MRRHLRDCELVEGRTYRLASAATDRIAEEVILVTRVELRDPAGLARDIHYLALTRGAAWSWPSRQSTHPWARWVEV